MDEKAVKQMDLDYLNLISHSYNYKKMLFSIMDIVNLENPFQFFTQLLIQKLLNRPFTIVSGLNGNEQQDISLIYFQFLSYPINELREFMEDYTAIYLTHGTSETLLFVETDRDYRLQTSHKLGTNPQYKTVEDIWAF